MTVTESQTVPVSVSGKRRRMHPEVIDLVGDFDQFYRTHRASVARTLSLTLGDDALGHEAADEAMARAFERWDAVSTYANPEGWVYRTGLNWARSWLRRRKRAKERDPLVAAQNRTFDQPGDTDLARALTTLGPNQRAVVVLRFYRDWSVEQTADALGIAPGTVKSRLNRALERLNHELGSSHAPREETAALAAPHQHDERKDWLP